ncbi:unnamed protein product [Aureobasidium uvarum]|uniref:Uncharacterized protein n=1 Tax=Aureobasidium uvarum TaxID=2773716 RepID=A0A9N8PPI5_9PEZI|nr:unnamed protein product [Aureobasidium uvarum]
MKTADDSNESESTLSRDSPDTLSPPPYTELYDYGHDASHDPETTPSGAEGYHIRGEHNSTFSHMNSTDY